MPAMRALIADARARSTLRKRRFERRCLATLIARLQLVANQNAIYFHEIVNKQ